MKTPEQKAKEKLLKNIKIVHSGILAAFSFKRITTWTDLYKHLGQSTVDDKPITYKELQQYLANEYKRAESGTGSGQQSTVDKKHIVTEAIDSIAKQPQSLLNSDGSIQQDKAVDVIAQAQLLAKEANEKTKLSADNNYGLVPLPNEKIAYYWFQKKAIAEMVDKTMVKKYPGILLLAPTGSGKTPMFGGLLNRWRHQNMSEGKTLSHMPEVFVTKSTILTQIGRDFNNFFGIKPNVDVEVINIEALRSSAGQFWIKEEVYLENGVEKSRWTWKRRLQPALLGLDESQGVKRPKSKQSQIFHAYNDLPPNERCLVSISATPFVRVCEAKAFAVSTNRDISHLGFPPGTKLTNKTWPAYAQIIASPSKPEDYCEAAVARLRKDLEDYIVQVKGVKPQFEADNGVKIVHFKTPEQREYYRTAWERFLKEKAKIDEAKAAGDTTNTCYLVVLLKFAMAAEFCHAEEFADSMHEDYLKGYAPVTAVKFKQTLIEIVNILITKHKWKRQDISLIWGGGQTQLTKKQKAKKKIKDMEEEFKKMGVDVTDLLKDTGLDEVEDRVIKDYPSWLKLGLQSKQERQDEIDRFQSGKSKAAIYTLKSGGVGLSLQHCDTLSPFKCRRKESGYVVEEDIPKVPIRPRTTRVCVTYNAIELVQGIGRVPRINSLSVTHQRVHCFADTVEVEMGRVYSTKLRCLGAFVRQKEDWMPIIFGGYKAPDEAQKFIDKCKDVELDESTLVNEGDDEVEVDEEEIAA